MNLETHIKPELWQAISRSYDSQNYTNAIKDAFHYLTDILRDKSDLDGDGEKLIGDAFGGSSPRIKVNSLQTVSEKNVQDGLQQTLRGIYKSIRNPRSHEKFKDDEKTANSIIFFIDYLTDIIDQSESFTVEKYLNQLFDPNFVKDARYVELLVSEIPPGRRLDVLVEIYQNKINDKDNRLHLIVSEILKHLTADQTSRFLQVVSAELRELNDEDEIKHVFQLLPVDLWLKIDELPKRRIENIALKMIQHGKSYYSPNNQEFICSNPRSAQATWIRDFLPYFSNKKAVIETLIEKIQEGEMSGCFTIVFFWSALPDLSDDSFDKVPLLDAIVSGIENGEYYLWTYISKMLNVFPEDWRDYLIKELEHLADEKNPLKIIGRKPFLTKSMPPEGPLRPPLPRTMDDIPF